MDSYDILVVILSVMLSLFLLLGIIALGFVVKIVRSIKRITDKAENFADSMETAGDFFKKASAPVAVSKMVHNLYTFVKDQDKKGRKK